MLDAGRRFGKYLLFEGLSRRPGREGWRARAAVRGRSAELVSLAIPPHELARFFPLFTEELSRAGFLLHGNVRGVHEFGQIEGHPFYTQEDVPGTDLAAVLTRCREQRIPFPITAAVFVAREVAAALTYAHARRLRAGAHLGVVHAAVLPSEVRITADGDVKLGGFGVLRALQRLGLVDGFVDLEEKPLLAPEVRGARVVGPRADVYGCAAVLYAAITLRSPAEASRSGRPVPPSSLRGKVSAAIDALCSVALAEEPNERHARAEELVAELSRILYQESPMFASRDLGELLAALHDGSLSHSMEERRRLRPLDPRREDDDGEILEEASEVRVPAAAWKGRQPAPAAPRAEQAPPDAPREEQPPPSAPGTAAVRRWVAIAVLLVAGLVGLTVWWLVRGG
jgi:serine/threonine protein kinase